MSVANYGILRGAVIDAIPFKQGIDHFQIEVKADDIYRIAVDVYSQFSGAKQQYAADKNNTLDSDRMVMFHLEESFQHPLLEKLVELPQGFTPKSSLDESLCLDYLRTTPTLFDINKMKVLQPKSIDHAEGGNRSEDIDHTSDSLNDDINPFVQEALNNNDAEVFAFGAGWDDNAPGSHPDTRSYFKPDPAKGIHDIHMNQGDVGKEAKYNGTFQDGALFFHFKADSKWSALFFRFQVQSLHTNEQGDPVNEKNASLPNEKDAHSSNGKHANKDKHPNNDKHSK